LPRYGSEFETRPRGTIASHPRRDSGVTWYANPPGGLTFVNERLADYLGLPKDHPLRLGVDMGAEWDPIFPFCIRTTATRHAECGQTVYAWATPVR